MRSVNPGGANETEDNLQSIKNEDLENEIIRKCIMEIYIHS